MAFPDSDFLSRLPLLRLLIPLISGIAAGHFFSDYLTPWLPWLFCVAAVGVACLFVVLRFYSRAALFGLYAATALLGTVLIVADSKSTDPLSPTVPRTWRAVVCTTPRLTAKAKLMTVRLVEAGKHTGCRISLTLIDSSATRVKIGDPLLFHAALQPPPDATNPGTFPLKNYLQQQGIDGVAHCYQNEWKVSSVKIPITLQEHLLTVRQRCIEIYRSSLSPHTVAVLSAMTLGDRTSIERSTRALYSDSGASHVLALSGLHLAILYGCYMATVGYWACRRGRRWEILSSLLLLVGIWLFVFLAGIPISLLRAALMFSITMLLGMGYRRVSAGHSLSLSVLLMLLINPSWLFDIGFQLSCLAVAGILYATHRFPIPKILLPLSRRTAELTGRQPMSLIRRCLLSVGRSLWSLFLASSAAQIITAPLVAYYFHRLPWSGILTSFVVIPAAYLLLSGAFFFLLFPPLRAVLSAFLDNVLCAMENLLAFSTHGVLEPLSCYPSCPTVILFYGFLLLCIFPSFRHRQVAVIAVFLLAGFSFMLDRERDHCCESQIWIYYTPGCTALHLINTRGQTWLLASDTLAVRQSLSQVNLHFWRRHNWKTSFLPLGALSDISGCRRLQKSLPSVGVEVPIFAPRVVLFSGKRIAVVDERLSYAFPRRPLQVDILLVGHEAKRPLEHLLRFYTPHRLVLSPAVSEYYRQCLSVEASKRHLSCYDVKESGAFQLPRAEDRFSQKKQNCQYADKLSRR